MHPNSLVNYGLTKVEVSYMFGPDGTDPILLEENWSLKSKDDSDQEIVVDIPMSGMRFPLTENFSSSSLLIGYAKPVLKLLDGV